MTFEVEFVDELPESVPRGGRKQRVDWMARLAQVEAQPGRWAIIGRFETNGQAEAAASGLRRTGRKGWMFAVRWDGEHRLYARFDSPDWR